MTLVREIKEGENFLLNGEAFRIQHVVDRWHFVVLRFCDQLLIDVYANRLSMICDGGLVTANRRKSGRSGTAHMVVLRGILVCGSRLSSKAAE